MKKYENIYNTLLREIRGNLFPLSSNLPSETELCNRFNTSRITVRKALHELEVDGFIRKRQGKSSIVISNKAKPKTVLLIVPSVFKYIFSELVEGIETTLRKHNITLLIANSKNNQNIERTIIRNYIDIVDAIIFEPAQVANTNYNDSKTYNKLTIKPTVCINSTINQLNIPSLTLDDYQNMKLVTSYVVSKNVKRVLVLSKTDDFQGYSRLNGIKDVLSTSNIDSKIVEFTTETEVKKLDDFSFLYFHYKPDCIMFYNDEYAFQFLTKYNINPITDNILITGFDNTSYSNGKPYSFISPNHPKGEMGIDAANMIVDLLNDKKVFTKKYLPNINLNK